jgi:hypothetical protein
LPALIPLNPTGNGDNGASVGEDAAADAAAIAAALVVPAASADVAPAVTGLEQAAAAWPTLDTSRRPAPAPGAPARRPRRVPTNPVRELVKIVAGGVAGLAIGYAILLWMGGPKNDFLALWPRLPAWLRDRLSHAASPVGENHSETRAMHEHGGRPQDDAGTPLLAAPSDKPSETASEPEAPPTNFPLGAAVASPLDVREALANLQAALEPTGAGDGAAAPPARERLEAAALAWERLAAALTRLPEGAERQAAVDQVQRLVDRWLSAGDAAGELNRRVIARLTEEGRDYRGVALAGRLELVERRGAWFTSHLVLSGQPKLVVLISPEPPPVKPGSDVVVLGALVAAPRERFPLYEGPPQGPAVWLGAVAQRHAPPHGKEPVTGP